MRLAEALEWRRKIRRLGAKLVFTNGCFDLLHRGHAEYLLDARKLGDYLVVAINSDASVRAIKGPSRPVVNQDDRAFLLASFAFVDAVVIFAGRRCTNLIRDLKPDIYAKGGDYTISTIDSIEKTVLLKAGTDIEFVKFKEGFSTTGIIRKVRN